VLDWVTLYSPLFGWDIQAAGPGYRLVPPQDGGIGGGLMKVRDAMQPYVTFYVQVEDLQASLDRRSLGGRRHQQAQLRLVQILHPTASSRARLSEPSRVLGRDRQGRVSRTSWTKARERASGGCRRTGFLGWTTTVLSGQSRRFTWRSSNTSAARAFA